MLTVMLHSSLCVAFTRRTNPSECLFANADQNISGACRYCRVCFMSRVDW